MNKKITIYLLIMALVSLLIPISFVHAQPVTLFTPYTGLTVSPGETITYNVDVINYDSSVKNITFEFNRLPKDWTTSITAGGNSIKQLSIKPDSEEAITLEVNVPLEVKKADYRFELVAKGSDGSTSTLPFLVSVAEEGTAKSNLTTEQPNREGHADSTFNFTANLKNDTAERQNYALSAQAPEGWAVQFKVDGENITSIALDPNEAKSFDIDIIPAENVQQETYTIPIQANSGSSQSELELEVHISGQYSMNLTTPEGKLSTDVTAGKERKVELVVENDGTSELFDIQLSADTPPNWQVTFDNDQIASIKPGEKASVIATIHAPDDAIAGDYVTVFSAANPAVSSEAVFRVSVKTSMVWGLFGVAIILGVLGGLYYIFKKYGRR